MRLVFISNVSYLQITFNLQLKNEHVLGAGLTRWSLGMFFMGLFSPFSYFEHMCLKNIIFNKIKGAPVIFHKKPSGRLILNKESWEWVFCKRKSIFYQFEFFTFILTAFIDNFKSFEKSPFF